LGKKIRAKEKMRGKFRGNLVEKYSTKTEGIEGWEEANRRYGGCCLIRGGGGYPESGSANSRVRKE